MRRAQTLTLVRGLLYVAFAVLVFFTLRRLAVVIAPLATGLFLAYLMNPAVSRLERHMPRWLAITLLLLLFLTAFAVIAVLLPPLLSSEIETFSERWHSAQDRIQNAVMPWARKSMHLSRSATAEDLVQKAIARTSDAWESASLTAIDTIGGAFRTATGVLRFLVAVLLTPVFAIYFLSDFPRLKSSVGELVPPRHRKVVFSLLSEINHALASWVRGQLTVMFVLGLLYAVGFALTGLPLGIAIGLFIGLAAFVPYVGVLVGLVIALAVALLDPHPASAVVGVIATVAAVQTLDTLFVTPRILGGRVGLSPVMVIFALTLGGELLGYAGVLLAVPCAAVVKVLLTHARRRYAKSVFYVGELELSSLPSSALTPVADPIDVIATPAQAAGDEPASPETTAEVKRVAEGA